ncbi:Uu.00g069090.m01.CDS01 [Anthostomella pinea]|uniref:Uu.00g069090.m01.CDS01 n=1 Tax=Anthostomella pinea TaxID=933095 RepID=A0AAI8YNE8_9PEZI|nr:Uu.00g069090.m01.CDS01 [Anthostomella pinea]
MGLRGLQGDDFFALLTLIFYTMDAATVNIIYHTATNVEATQLAKTRTLTAEEIAQFEFGSREELAAWYSYTALIWCLKGTMLCFFKRMTMGSTHNKLVNWLMGACAASYAAVFLTVTFGCFPYHHNWQVVPDPGDKCTFKLQNFLVTVTLNVITDAAILCIPLPLLWKLQIPLKKKLVIGLLLSSGLFVISAAIIRVVLTLSANPSALNINRWGVRETIVGIISVNIPILRPLFSRSFWNSSPITSSGSHSKGGKGGTTTAGGQGPYEMASSINGSQADDGGRKSFNGSEEHIIGKPGDGNVVVSTTYNVTSEENTYRNSEIWGSRGGSNSAVAYRGLEIV